MKEIIQVQVKLET